MIPNDLKLRIHGIDKLDTDYVIKKNKAISSIENTIKYLHIQKNMHLIYRQDLYKDKQKEINELFIEYLIPIMGDLDHPTLIEEWKHNIDAAAHEKNQTKM